jgi:hypothetical protein
VTTAKRAGPASPQSPPEAQPTAEREKAEVKGTPETTSGVRVPDVTGMSVLDAALAYAGAGLYVGPLRRRSKHPGSVLGYAWQGKTSRDPDRIRRWFPPESKRGVFLHCGRSGLVVFDVDRPENLHELLDLAVASEAPPWQNTRPDHPDRRHYLFAVPPGRKLGNSVGTLGKGWGEVRGKNGVIVVAPSEHEDPDGLYTWGHVGLVPVLPAYLADELPDALDAADAATDADVEAFIAEYDSGDRHDLLARLVNGWSNKVHGGESRHDSMTGHLAGALKEAAAGLYPARAAVGVLESAFLHAVAVDGHSPDQSAARTPGEAAEEWDGLLTWAVAQAKAADPADTLARVAEHDSSPEVDFAEPLPDDTASLEGTVATAEKVFNDKVQKRAEQLRISKAARELVAREALAEAPVLEPVNLADFLAEPDEDVRYRVDRLLPTGGRVVFAAANKAGKTTTIGNLVRCLVDGGRFLGEFEVEQAERVVLLDNELDPRMIRSWLRDQAITNAGAVGVLSLRGRLSGFNILDPVVRAEWARALGPADLLVFDCLRPALDALGLSEDKDAGRFLVALDELVAEAGVSELVVVHHMGHSNERSRGDSRILDWPDALWKIVKENAEDHASARYFSAYGRDVDHPESRLAYDLDTRHLSLAGGSRRQSRTSQAEADVLDFVSENPGCSVTDIDKGLLGDTNAKRDAAKSLAARGVLRIEKEGNKHAHYLADPAADFADEAL